MTTDALYDWSRRVLAEAGIWPPRDVEDIDITGEWPDLPGDYTETYGDVPDCDYVEAATEDD